MEESQIGIEIAKGIKGALQDFLAPNVRTIINELQHHTKQLDEHGKKLDKIGEEVHTLALRQAEMNTLLKLQERIADLEKMVTAQQTMLPMLRGLYPEVIEGLRKKEAKK